MSEKPTDSEELELLLFLGMMVRDAATMELMVASIAGHLRASHDPKAAPIGGQPLGVLISKCEAAAHSVPRVDAEQRGSLQSLLTRVRAVADLRNAYVHGTWVKDFDGSYSGVRGKRGQSSLIEHALSGEQLRDMIKEIRSINDGLTAWLAHDINLTYEAPEGHSEEDSQ
ncbi:hypothetical protein [Streptomyces sp. NPDC057403]|uniref:hypothetical protein n=1 Tax=Streptomyces sp. NPDC057403 TaxID=3346119 RepID=UPI003687BA46